MRLTFLGTCAGTEPMPGRRHSSFVVEHNDALYWFDTGENCSYAAHLLGIDLLSTRAIFITHRHVDHVGGLPNLLWTIRKLNTFSELDPKPLHDRTVQVFMPDMSIWDAVWGLVKKYPDFTFPIEAAPPEDGLVFEEDGLRVVAAHNNHLGQPAENEPWESFSYRIEADGRRVVYSGDIAAPSDVEPLLGRTDLVLMETGHHTVEDVSTYLRDSGHTIGRLGFVHHGRAVLADPDGELKKAQGILGDGVFLAEDGMSLEV